MGSAQSAKRKKLFTMFPLYGYQRLSESDSPNLLTQPLLHDQNYNLTKEIDQKWIEGNKEDLHNPSMEIRYQVQAYFEKEIRGLKSNLSTLESTMLLKLQSSQPKEAAITSLEQKFEKLKQDIDGVITAREANKQIALSNQGEVDFKRVQEKNISLEKQFSQLKTRVNEITSSMDEMSVIIADFKHLSLQPKEETVSAQVRIPELLNTTVSVSEDTLFIILVFLVGLLIGYIIL